MNNFKSLFAFDRKQQRGIFVLMLLLIIVLAGFFYVKQMPKEALNLKDTTAYQNKVDSLARAQQRRRDTI